MRARRWTAVATAGAVLAALAAPSGADHADLPPKMTARSHGVSVNLPAGAFSWCPGHEQPCAFTATAAPAPMSDPLPVHAGARVDLLPRMDATGIRIYRSDRGGDYATARRDPENDRRWRFRVPRSENANRRLYVAVDYGEHGMVLWGLRLRLHNHSSR